MKKLNVLSLALALGLFTTVGFAANTVVENTNAVVVEQEVSKTPVEVADLPEAVTEALQAKVDEGWVISEAALITDEEKTLYVVKLTKGEETKTKKITPEGEIK
ncbi:hypothetical protein [Geofilum rubicundum]|uniref:PepSY domain-containing protein n=1 Tax=Geofilum rubicundum JCM 15548 TaxID=1236989 RepID=A0A0E9LV94_9BACT|nr:hypothetical protein [Geofilum rubicundum]GAO29228.1 hypothetical protein JCM15548_11395 [Geofilum rubicundum JCM 15548]